MSDLPFAYLGCHSFPEVGPKTSYTGNRAALGRLLVSVCGQRRGCCMLPLCFSSAVSC